MGRHPVLEVTVYDTVLIIRIPELLLVEIFSLFALSNYGINCQKQWYQPAVSVLLYRVQIQCMCRFLMFCFSAVCFFINVSYMAEASRVRGIMRKNFANYVQRF